MPFDIRTRPCAWPVSPARPGQRRSGHDAPAAMSGSNARAPWSSAGLSHNSAQHNLCASVNCSRCQVLSVRPCRQRRKGRFVDPSPAEHAAEVRRQRALRDSACRSRNAPAPPPGRPARTRARPGARARQCSARPIRSGPPVARGRDRGGRGHAAQSRRGSGLTRRDLRRPGSSCSNSNSRRGPAAITSTQTHLQHAVGLAPVLLGGIPHPLLVKPQRAGGQVDLAARVDLPPRI